MDVFILIIAPGRFVENFSKKEPNFKRGCFLIEKTSKDTSLLTICEQLDFHLLEDGKEKNLLKILTSLLSMHVGEMIKFLLFVIDGKVCEGNA